jgi:hypothetical protein
MQINKHSARITDMAHQNALLKKAVAIQHQRNLRATADKEAHMQQLKSVLDECQSRNASLEAANYALNVHLKQATAQQRSVGGPPDVY